MRPLEYDGMLNKELLVVFFVDGLDRTAKEHI